MRRYDSANSVRDLLRLLGMADGNHPQIRVDVLANGNDLFPIARRVDLEIAVDVVRHLTRGAVARVDIPKLVATDLGFLSGQQKVRIVG